MKKIIYITLIFIFIAILFFQKRYYEYKISEVLFYENIFSTFGLTLLVEEGKYKILHKVLRHTNTHNIATISTLGESNSYKSLNELDDILKSRMCTYNKYNIENLLKNFDKSELSGNKVLRKNYKEGLLQIQQACK